VTPPSAYREESPAIQAHLGIAQSVIQRMAANSASCKAWCIGLVSAILVVVADKNKADYAVIALLPTGLFFVLDTYYLALARCFRASYNAFIDKLHAGGVTASDLYAITPKGSVAAEFFKSLRSFSVWPLYLTLAVMVLVSACLLT